MVGGEPTVTPPDRVRELPAGQDYRPRPQPPTAIAVLAALLVGTAFAVRVRGDAATPGRRGGHRRRRAHRVAGQPGARRGRGDREGGGRADPATPGGQARRRLRGHGYGLRGVRGAARTRRCSQRRGLVAHAPAAHLGRRLPTGPRPWTATTRPKPRSSRIRRSNTIHVRARSRRRPTAHLVSVTRTSDLRIGVDGSWYPTVGCQTARFKPCRAVACPTPPDVDHRKRGIGR